MGTWIEIGKQSRISYDARVVPHVGTWIEIIQNAEDDSKVRRSPRGNVD